MANEAAKDVFPRPHWEFDHLGHAVSDLEAAVNFYVSRLGFVEELRETVQEQHVDVAFLRLGTFVLELLSPLDETSSVVSGSPSTGLKKFLEKRGPGLHHMAYRVNSVGQELKLLREAGFRLIDEKPRSGSRGMSIAFLHPQSCNGVLVELCGSS